jgi:hypothetical protein
MASIIKTPKKRRPAPKVAAGRPGLNLGRNLGRNLGLNCGLLGLPVVGAGMTYYFMDKFQVQRDFRIRGESAHVMRTNGGSLDVATAEVDKTIRDGPTQQKAPTQARVDAQARVTLNTFIQNWRTKNREMGPVEAWPVEILFE